MTIPIPLVDALTILCWGFPKLELFVVAQQGLKPEIMQETEPQV